MNAITNCINQMVRKNTMQRIRDGQIFYIHNGEEIPARQFNEMFPVPMFVKQNSDKFKGSNVDHTKDWLQD